MTRNEEDIRVSILNTLLTTPHRDLAKVWPVHEQMLAQDPRFYVRLAAWYAVHGEVRDHQEMFVINLALSTFPGHREVGLALLRAMPPYQVVRVVDFISGRKKTRKVKSPDANDAGARKGRRAKARQALVGAATVEAPRPATEEFGLFRSVPRSMRTEVVRYLRERESDADWFDGCVLTARKAMKRLYALLHVKPDERAQQILFDNQPPVGSRLYALRELASASDPTTQAQAIVEHGIPYRVACTVVHQMTPTVLIALIGQMSSQELMNSMGVLKRRGALDIPEVAELIQGKLAEAKTANRVSALKADKAIDAVGAQGALREALEEVADTQVKAKGRISRPTALLVDKSSSMHDAIELGKRIGSMVSAICEADLFTYVFDTMAHEIVATGDKLADWERAFQGVTAGGATSCGVALKLMERNKQYVEQIILVTDEGENTPPLFVEALNSYQAALAADPNVLIVRTPGAGNYLERQCRAAKMAIDVFQFGGDYYSLPNLVPMLTRPSKLELLMDIMEYPLPERKAA